MFRLDLQIRLLFFSFLLGNPFLSFAGIEKDHHQDSHANAGGWDCDAIKVLCQPSHRPFGSENLDDAASAINDYFKKLDKDYSNLTCMVLLAVLLNNPRFSSIGYLEAERSGCLIMETGNWIGNMDLHDHRHMVDVS
ncbi:unnamed protein product [Sphenostylis stenocarpa]|uniref:Uncharacterized protein n=1 Tax=Sphenostylis stenocarpa TaxID=92480 RepID=A0AA86W5Z1_9FABA|nr:unnamed protein product [Sphenostylis stenocarpa]